VSVCISKLALCYWQWLWLKTRNRVHSRGYFSFSIVCKVNGRGCHPAPPFEWICAPSSILYDMKNSFDWQANRIGFGMTNYLAFTVSCSSPFNWLCRDCDCGRKCDCHCDCHARVGVDSSGCKRNGNFHMMSNWPSYFHWSLSLVLAKPLWPFIMRSFSFFPSLSNDVITDQVHSSFIFFSFRFVSFRYSYSIVSAYDAIAVLWLFSLA